MKALSHIYVMQVVHDDASNHGIEVGYIFGERIARLSMDENGAMPWLASGIDKGYQ